MNNKIRNAILDLAQKKNQVVYGQQSVNVQVPAHLRRKTIDYDIKTAKAKQSATELANTLNEKYKTNKFNVQEGQHKGTYKVKYGKKSIADYTQTTKKPNTYNELGVKYANLEYQKKKLKSIIKNKEFEYRHKKDKESLNKIAKSEMAWLAED